MVRVSPVQSLAKTSVKNGSATILLPVIATLNKIIILSKLDELFKRLAFRKILYKGSSVI